LACGDHAAARTILSGVTEVGTPRYRIERGILTALALASGDINRAHAPLHEALTLAESAGFQQSIVNEGPPLWALLRSLPTDASLERYVTALLRVAEGLVPAARTPNQNLLVEPLSERELTVLRYLTSKLDATEIASALYISVNTVRSHIKAIYRKLGVATRADAVRNGQSLGLI
jgi:LuxR family transcriptional regulator, maltose regulon positive regulatory protein